MADDGAMVSKLLEKLKESQDMFDSLESMFDRKVHELGQTEQAMAREAENINSLGRMLGRDTTTTTADPLTSVPNRVGSDSAVSAVRAFTSITSPQLGAAPAPMPLPHLPTPVPAASPRAGVLPAAAPAGAAAEVAVLQERIRVMALEHQNHLRVQEQNLQARIDREVGARTAQCMSLLDRMKLDAIKQREETNRRLSEQQADLERVREAARRAENEQREVFLAKERELLNQVQSQVEEETKVSHTRARTAQADLERCQLAVEELRGEVERKDHSLTMANDTISGMKAQHQKAMDALEVLTSKHQAVANEALRAASSLSMLSESRDQLAKEYAELQTSYEQQMQNLKQTRDELEKRKTVTDGQQSELQLLRRQATDAHTAHGQQSEAVNALTLERNTLARKVEELTARSERQLKQRQREIEQQCEERVAMLTAEVKAKAGRLAEVQAKCDEMREYRDMNTDANMKLRNAQTRVVELEAQLKEREREIESRMDKAKYLEEITLKLHSAELREMSLEERVRDLQTALSDKEREVASLQNRVAVAEDTRMQLTAAEARATSAAEREKEASEQLRQKKVELNAAAEKVRNLDDIRTRLREEMAALRAQNESLRDRDEQHRQRDIELAACKDEMNRAALELDRRAEEIKALKAQTEDVMLLREQCAKFAEVRDMLAGRDAKLDTAARELAKLEVASTQRSREYEQVVAELEAKEAELAQQQAVLAAAEEDVRELVRTREELEVVRAEGDRMRVLLEAREVTLNSKAAELSAGCEELMTSQKSLAHENTALREEVEEAQRRVDHLNTIVQHKDFLLAQRLKDDGDDGKLKDLRAWVDEKVADAAKDVARSDEAREAAERKVRRLEEELAMRTEEVESLNAVVARLRSELEAQQMQALRPAVGDDQVEAVQGENDALRTHLHKLQGTIRDREDERVAFEEKVIQLSSELAAQRDANELLAEANADLQNAVDEASPEQHTADQFLIDSLETKYDALRRENAAISEAACAKDREIRALKLQRMRAPAGNVPHAIVEPAATTPTPARSDLRSVSKTISARSDRDRATRQESTAARQQISLHSHTSVAKILPMSDTFDNLAAAHGQDPADNAPAPRSPLEYVPRVDSMLNSTHSAVFKRVSSGVVRAPSEAAEEPAEKRATMGVLLDEEATHEGAVKVADVKMGGPAYQAGMRKGDFLKLIGKRPASATELNRVLCTADPLDMIEVVFLRIRAGQPTEFVQDVRLAALPKQPGLARTASAHGAMRRVGSVQGAAAARPTTPRATPRDAGGAPTRARTPRKSVVGELPAAAVAAAAPAPAPTATTPKMRRHPSTGPALVRKASGVRGQPPTDWQ